MIQPITGGFQHHIQRVEHVIGVVSRATDHQVATIHGLEASRRYAHRPHRRQSWQGGQVVHQVAAAIAPPVCQKTACRGRVREGGPGHVPDVLGRADLIEQPNIPHRGVIRERHIALAHKVARARHDLPFSHPYPIQPNGQLPANVLIAEGQAVQIPVKQGRGQDAVQKAINRGRFKLQRPQTIGVAVQHQIAKARHGAGVSNAVLPPDQFQREGRLQKEINRRRLQCRARSGIGGDKGKAWRRWRTDHTVAAQHVIACAAIQCVAARSALQRVMAVAPKQRVATATAPHQIGRRIAGDRIGAAPAKGMFDHRTKGDA